MPIAPQDLGLEQVVALARAGNEAARRIFDEAGRVLGIGIANVINVFNPRLVIITGEGISAGSLLFDPMREAIQRYSFAGLDKDAEIVIQQWGDDAWARGAASLVLQEFFRAPVSSAEPLSDGRVKKGTAPPRQ
jgi:predicted NBD/HSP70 family sugar kinase